MRRKMKKVIVCVLVGIVAAALMIGCGGSSGSSSSADYAAESGANYDTAGDGFDYDYENGAYGSDDYSEEVAEEGAIEEKSATDLENSDVDTGSSGSSETGSDSEKNISEKKIEQDKLIYSCDMTVDTLDYAESVKSFKSLIEKYDGFVQSENESDDAGYDEYYVRDGRVDVRYTYTATVRVPSKDYDAFLEETGAIGDVRSKNANVQNVSQDYYNLAAELEVLQTKYQRYLDMLSKAKTTQDILSIENSITTIETQINQIKTQLNRYDTDVAYSFVNITIRQVKEYVDDETDKTTVPGAIVDSWKSFVNVAHGLLIALIYLLPYLLIMLVILIVVLIIVKVNSKNKKNKGATPQVPPLPNQVNDDER